MSNSIRSHGAMSSKKGGNEKNVEYDVFPPEESHKIFIEKLSNLFIPPGHGAFENNDNICSFRGRKDVSLNRDGLGIPSPPLNESHFVFSGPPKRVILGFIYAC